VTAGTQERAEPGGGTRTGLSRTARGLPVPPWWERADRRIDEHPLVDWAAAIGIGLLALGLRLWQLGTPREFSFDETYYAKDAWSLLHFGYAQNYGDRANENILAGSTADQWTGTPEIAVHPEVGKWLIAVGEKLFGMDPFGWRVSACVVGALMVVLMVRFARRLTRSTLLGCVAGLLLCFDGLHFVLSRLALLDIFVAFFVLLAVHCMVADRDWCRRKVARLVPERLDSPRAWGPVRALLFRPWLLAAGGSWGLAIGTKWTAVYLLAAFGLLYVAWSAGMRRALGVRRSLLRAPLADGVTAFVHLVVVAVCVYVATWTPWMMHASVFEEHLSSTEYTQFTGKGHCEDESYVAENLDKGRRWPTATEPDASGPAEVVQSLRTLWYYHRDVYTFHTHFLNCSEHSYGSDPLGWLLLNRPVGVNAQNTIHPPGWTCPASQRAEDECPKKEEVSYDPGCSAAPESSCLRQVLLLGNPVLWWVGCVALIAAVVLWLGARDWRHGVAVVGTVASWLPWLLYDDRPIFSFYTIITLPFLVLATTLVIGRLIAAPAGRPTPRRTVGVIVSGAFFVLVVLAFAWFWPVYTNDLLTRGEWLDRIWFDRWI